MGDTDKIPKMSDPPTPKQKRDEQRYHDNMDQFAPKGRGCMVYFLVGFGGVLCAFLKFIY